MAKEKKYIRIGEAAEMIGVSVGTLRHYCQRGLIKHRYTPYGHRIFDINDVKQFTNNPPRKNGATNPNALNNDDTTTPEDDGKTAFYIRASDGNAASLRNQEKELTNAYGEPDKTYKDRASGLSETRPGLKRLIQDVENGEIRHIKVTYEDRLTRFGYSYLEHIITKAGADIETLHEKKEEPQEELMNDFMNLTASFSGRFYKMRSTENQQKLLKKAEQDLEARKKKE